ncbi:MAG: universal stress protein [Planctomycetota bacterium]|jgi:nucleotide-binding universal stress UspA family protein
MIRRILVALSGTPFSPVAIQHAVDLAQRHAASITGVTVTDLARLASVGPVPMGAGAAAHELADHRIQITEERVKEQIDQFEAACSEADVRHRVVCETGDPMQELANLWRTHDFTVFGLRGLFEYGVVHNPDAALTNLIKAGVRPILAAPRTFRPIRRAFIAYNGSIESAKAMKRFVQSQLWPIEQVRIACFEYDESKARSLVDEAAGYCRDHDLDTETAVIETEPRDTLVTEAEAWGADVIVLGSTSRARLLQQVLGDTVLQTIRTSNTALFLSQ